MNDVLEIANRYLRKIKKTGPENIMAICPFHRKANGEEESTPSFTMSLTKGVYFCFACHERGNLYTFLRDVGITKQHIETHYRPLLDDLRSNQPKRMDPLRPAVLDHSPIPESFLGLFDMCPIDLLKDGFSEEILQKYDIGFDKNHMRITFPLRDLYGNLVGISGRTVVDEYPRYKVYDTEYQAWGYPVRRTDKRFVLWNADKVYPNAFFEKGAKVIIVEGFKACLRLIQYGLPNTVALLGTYLSEEQKWILERIGGEVYIMLDNDNPGRIGAAQVGKQLAESLTVKIVEYTKPQPSDLGPEEVRIAFKEAKDFHLWVTETENKWLLEKIRRD